MAMAAPTSSSAPTPAVTTLHPRPVVPVAPAAPRVSPVPATGPPVAGPQPAAETPMQRLLEMLARERALSTHDSVVEIDVQVGRSSGYLGRVLRGEIGLQVDMLFRVLEALEVDPSSFFASLVGFRIEPKTSAQRLMRLLEGASEKPAVPLGDAARQHLERLVDLPPLSETSRAPEADDAPQPTWLDASIDLDERRFSDPAATPKALAVLLERALSDATTHSATTRDAERQPSTRRALAHGLGVAASVERTHGAPRAAARYLHLALGFCDDPTCCLYADLMLRLCYQLGDQGELGDAHELTRQAVEVYLCRGDLAGVGRALVAQAVMAYRRDQAEVAIRCYTAALRYLPPGAWQSRFAAWQGKGLCHLQLQQIEAADACAQRAVEAHLTRCGLPWWRLVWLQAEVAYRRGELERAETLYRQCQEAFDAARRPLETAQLALHLSKVLLASGKLAELCRVAAGTMALVRPLKRHPHAATVLEDLTRRALTSELTTGWLERACQVLDRGPARKAS